MAMGDGVFVCSRCLKENLNLPMGGKILIAIDSRSWIWNGMTCEGGLIAGWQE